MGEDGSLTLGEARDALRLRVNAGHAERCPLCTQNVAIQDRQLTNVPARALCTLWRYSRDHYAHLSGLVTAHRPDDAKQGGYMVLGRHWGLIQERGEERPDGGRAGYWRLTEKGIAFVEGRILVPKYAHIFDGRCLRTSGPGVHIADVIGKRFDLDELLGREVRGA